MTDWRQDTSVSPVDDRRRGSGFIDWFVPFVSLMGLTVIGLVAVLFLASSRGWDLSLFVWWFAVVGVVMFVPLLLLCTLAAWAVPATRYRAGWVGPIAAWVVSPFVAFAIDGHGNWAAFPEFTGALLYTAAPAALMIASYVLLRRRRRA